MASRKAVAKTGKATTAVGRARTSSDSQVNKKKAIFVRNVNYDTSEEALRSHFSQLVEERKIITIEKRIAHGQQFSKGCGQIEFDSRDTATYVSQNFNKTLLDGRELILKLCRPHEQELSSTKLFVGNVHRDAKEEEIRQIFCPFGKITSLTLPPPYLKKKRCFGFVEYETEQEAEHALEMLRQPPTYLHDCRLVVEKAKKKKRMVVEKAAKKKRVGNQNSAANIARKIRLQ